MCLTKRHRCLRKKVLQSKHSTKERAPVTNTHGQVTFNSHLSSKKIKTNNLSCCEAYMILGNANLFIIQSNVCVTKQTCKNNETKIVLKQ